MKWLPLLDVTMRTKRASNDLLAEVSGVSARTIQSARAGKPIRDFLADSICQALYENEFFASGKVNNWHSRRKITGGE